MKIGATYTGNGKCEFVVWSPFLKKMLLKIVSPEERGIVSFIVGGVVKVGLIKWMSIQMLDLTEGNLLATSMVVMWFSAFASAIVDNIPYVATMNPLVVDMQDSYGLILQVFNCYTIPI